MDRIRAMDGTWTRHLRIEENDLRITPPIRRYDTPWEKEINIDVDRMTNALPPIKAVLSTYCHHHPCDGYIQGMNFFANILIHKLGPQGAFWGMVKIMANKRIFMPCFDYSNFVAYCIQWEAFFHKFTDGRLADPEHVMALKWGIYGMSPSATPLEEIVIIWNAKVKLSSRLWPKFTAAVAAAACLRHLQKNADPYDARQMHTRLQFNNAAQLVRRAHRMIKHMDQK